MPGIKGADTKWYYAEESTYGTAVACTRRARLDSFDLAPETDKLVDESVHGERSPIDIYSGITKYDGSLEYKPTFEDIHLALCGFAENSPSTSGGSDPYVHTYTAGEPLKSLTVAQLIGAESGGTDARYEYAGLSVVGMRLMFTIGQRLRAELDLVAKSLDKSSSINTSAVLAAIHSEEITGLTGDQNNADQTTEVPYEPGTLQIDAGDSVSGTKLAKDSTPNSDGEFCENSDGTFDIYMPAADTDVTINYEVKRTPIRFLPTFSDIRLGDLTDALASGDSIDPHEIEFRFGGNMATEDYSTAGLEQPQDDGLMEATLTLRFPRATAAQLSTWRGWEEDGDELQFRLLIDQSSDDRSVESRLPKLVLMEIAGFEEHDGAGVKRPELTFRILPGNGENPTWPSLEAEAEILVENGVAGSFMI